MRRTTPTATRVLLATCLLLPAWPSARAADEKADAYEQERVERFADRVVRIVNTEHTRWLKVLEKAYPDRVAEPTKEEEYAGWFEVLAGGGDPWRRVSSPNSEVAALFDRVAESRRLGPVPSISREEFMRYADRELDRGRRRALGSIPDSNAEADKVFRALDADADGVLYAGEMTTAVRDAGRKADADLNGRIDRDEYRAFFRLRVAADNEAALARAARDDDDDDDRRTPRPKQADPEEMKLPEWFAEVDPDDDGQIALYEWRKAGGDLDYFMEMDLNEDGLLTEGEYRRWVKMNEKDDWDDPPDDE
jgi:Ca2+-binding EF-hand superfamily protein